MPPSSFLVWHSPGFIRHSSVASRVTSRPANKLKAAPRKRSISSWLIWHHIACIMKTLGLTTAKMQLAIVLLLAILAVQALAKPLAPYWDTNAEQDDYNTQLLHRSKRAAIVQSDYSFEAFHLRPSWRSSGCNGTYNCAPVTPSHCTDDSSNFFCLDEGRQLSACTNMV